LSSRKGESLQRHQLVPDKLKKQLVNSTDHFDEQEELRHKRNTTTSDAPRQKEAMKKII